MPVDTLYMDDARTPTIPAPAPDRDPYDAVDATIARWRAWRLRELAEHLERAAERLGRLT